MRRLGITKAAFLAVIVLLVLSTVMALASIYPHPETGVQTTTTLINDTFTLNPHEILRQGIGAFHGGNNQTDQLGENITVQVESPDSVIEEFRIVTYYDETTQNATYESLPNSTFHNTHLVQYTFVAGADYYEAIFNSSSPHSGNVHFEVSAQKPQITHPYAALALPAKILFFATIGLAMLLLLKYQLTKPTHPPKNASQPSLNHRERRALQLLVVLSLAVWLVAVLAFNANPLGTLENWYTDHARHSYTASLFLKDGFSVFSQPLGVLSSQDHSAYQYVTWPEMPHLYPLGSILLFLPFGVLLQSGVAPLVVFKLEVVLFLVFAHACLYLFLLRYWKQDWLRPQTFQEWKTDLRLLFQRGLSGQQRKSLLTEHTYLVIKLIGVYAFYATLIIFAADGMFDSVALLFCLFALTAFLLNRYDVFFLFFGVALFFKYQAAIFLLPLLVAAFGGLFRQHKPAGLLRNWKFLSALGFIALSGFTAVLSTNYLVQTRPELVMNGVNAFIPHAQISWDLQAFSVLLTLTATLIYVLYMHNKNRLLAYSALFLLAPSFLLPYFQNWYLPFLFLYALLPQSRRESAATIIWLIFIAVMLSFGGSAFNPLVITDKFQVLLNL
jgi:hypothetical protein